jgi:antitoxin VapB
MATARVFQSGNSQAVRLPREFRVSGKELEIFRRGDEIVLREKPATQSSAEIFKALSRLADFMEEAPEDLPPQTREGL